MPVALIIVLAALLVLLLAVWGAWALGFGSGERVRALKASAAEARDRSSDLSAEFFEWLRTGR